MTKRFLQSPCLPGSEGPLADWAGGDPEAKTFLPRHVAARHFLHGFVPAPGIEVKAAALGNGLLKIDLARKQVQPRLRAVEINIGGRS